VENKVQDFVYIDDVVEAFLVSLQTEETGYFPYNVCTGRRTTVSDVVKIITIGCGGHITVEYAGGTPGDQFGIYGDHQKITGQTGWEPATPFHDGVDRMIIWAKKTCLKK